MIATLLLTLLTAHATTCDQETDDLIYELMETPGIACYTTAADRSSLPIRENFLALSPEVDRIRRGEVFLGDRVRGENKILVYSPYVNGPIGLARYTFAREIPMSRCSNTARLHSPASNEIKGWGSALEFEEALPKPPGLHSSVGCYQRGRTQDLFWGTRAHTGGNSYARRVHRIRPDGTLDIDYPLWRVTRRPLADCSHVH